MAALLHHHGNWASLWDLVLCPGMDLRPSAASGALVCHPTVSLQRSECEAAALNCAEEVDFVASLLRSNDSMNFYQVHGACHWQ